MDDQPTAAKRRRLNAVEKWRIYQLCQEPGAKIGEILMKAKAVRAMFADLGLDQRFARPRTPDDNPFVLSLFGTVTSAPACPGWFPIDNPALPRQDFQRFFHWCNTEHYHCHSGIGYGHPFDKHNGRQSYPPNRSGTAIPSNPSALRQKMPSSHAGSLS